MTELFLDNNMIEVTPSVSRRLHQPKKHLLNPVVRSDRWWERDFLQPYSPMYDKKDKLFKMWARTGSDHAKNYLDGNAAYMTYLTSTDGIRWDKPKLGVVEIAGRRDHNVASPAIWFPHRIEQGPKEGRDLLCQAPPCRLRERRHSFGQ